MRAIKGASMGSSGDTIHDIEDLPDIDAIPDIDATLANSFSNDTDTFIGVYFSWRRNYQTYSTTSRLAPTVLMSEN